MEKKKKKAVTSLYLKGTHYLSYQSLEENKHDHTVEET